MKCCGLVAFDYICWNYATNYPFEDQQGILSLIGATLKLSSSMKKSFLGFDLHFDMNITF